MAECSDCNDAFQLAGRTGAPMNVVAVVQHTAGEYLGLIEDHLEGRRIRFQYFRPMGSLKAMMHVLRPQPKANTRAGATCTSSPLVC
jgi:hypothetical protein